MQRVRSKLIKFIAIFSLIAPAMANAAESSAKAPTDTEQNFFLDDPPMPEAPKTKVDEPEKKKTESVPSADSKSNSVNYTTTDSGVSEPRFDWSKHQGESEVQHPLADKGLVEVTKDKVYIYDVKHKEGNHGGWLHIGLFQGSNLKDPSGGTNSAFSDNYGGASNMMLWFDYEWQLWRIDVGKIGLLAGGGIMFAQGHGHYLNPTTTQPADAQTPPETFTFAVFPINFGAIYRVQIWDRQLIVPYGSGGATLYPFTELRDDSKGPKFGGSAGLFFAVGGALNLTYFDRFSALSLGRQYGINRAYFFGEFREVVNVARYDFGGPLLNFGFAADF